MLAIGLANMGREAIQRALHGYCFLRPETLKALAGGFAPKGEDRGPGLRGHTSTNKKYRGPDE